MLARQVDDCQRLLDVVDRDHQHLGRLRAGGAQQVQPRGIAIEHLVAESARRLDHVGVVVQHGGGDALRAQHAADDLPVAAEAGNDDRRVLRLADLLQLRRARWHSAAAAACRWPPAASGPSSIDSATAPISSEAVSGGSTRAPAAAWNTTKANSPPCASSRVNTGRSCTGMPIAARDAPDHHGLERHETQHDQRHEPGRLEQHAEVDAHAHGDEEQAQQQALEGLDVGFQLAPVFAFRQQHAGQEGAQRHRQAHELHQRGDRHHQQQRGGGEDLRRLLLAIQRSSGRSSSRPPRTMPPTTATILAASSQRPVPAMSLASRHAAQQRQQGQDREWPPRPGTAGWKSPPARWRWAAGCARPSPARRSRWTTAPGPAPPPG